MRRFLAAVVASVVFAGLGTSARSAEQDAKAVLDKAIKAVGGEERLSKVKAFTWKGKTSIKFGENENEFDGRMTIELPDRSRNEFSNEQFQGVIVLNGDKGWRKFGENVMEMDAESVERDKRTLYLLAAPTLLVTLKGKGFSVDSAPEEKVDGKPAAGIKATGPDGKTFTLHFDKESGLPVRMEARVVGFMGEDFTQVSTFSDYKDFDGIKKATKVVNTRDGQPFMTSHVTEFKPLDKVEADTFAEPK